MKKLSLKEIKDNEKGMVLIIAIALLAVLALVGIIVVKTTNTDLKISSNYKTGAQATYIAEAGAERAKNALKNVRFDDVLAGNIGSSTGILSFGTYTSFANGTYTVKVIDDDEDGDGVPCSDDGDDNCGDDDNGKIKIVATGITSNGSKRVIEVEVSKFPFDELPAAVTFVDNDNGDADEDRLKIESGTDIDLPAEYGTTRGQVDYVLITGQDTLDAATVAATTVGSGSGPDVRGMVSQEEFRAQGGVQSPSVLQNVGFNISDQTLCDPSLLDPNCPYAILDGIPSAYGTGSGFTNLNEGTIKEDVSFLQNNADYTITDNKISQTSYTALGTASDPRITYINQGSSFTIDSSITGYGIMVVDRELIISGNTSFEFHGIIYITCKGNLTVTSNSDYVAVWGAIIMINYGESGNCGGVSGEERLDVSKGSLRIYYSTDAINRYANPLTYTVDSWRQAF